MPPPPASGLVATMIRSALTRAHRAAAMAESATPGLFCDITLDPSRPLALAGLEDLPGLVVAVRIGHRRGTAKLSATASLNTMAAVLVEAGRRLKSPAPEPSRGGPRLAANPKGGPSRAAG